MEQINGLEEVNARIKEMKVELEPLLKEKQRLMRKQAEEIGCTCGVIIMDYDAHRLDNRFCKVHHPKL